MVCIFTSAMHKHIHTFFCFTCVLLGCRRHDWPCWCSSCVRGRRSKRRSRWSDWTWAFPSSSKRRRRGL